MSRNYLNGLDFLGDLGRRKKKHHHHGGGSHGGGQRPPPPVPAMGAMLPAGWPVFSFVLATGVNIISNQMNVQLPFRGQRMTAIVIRNGVSAAVTAPLIQTFLVGQKPIIASSNGVGLEIFAQNAFDTNLVLPETLPGIIYTLNVNLAVALLTTDSITCIVGLLGSAVWD